MTVQRLHYVLYILCTFEQKEDELLPKRRVPKRRKRIDLGKLPEGPEYDYGRLGSGKRKKPEPRKQGKKTKKCKLKDKLLGCRKKRKG